MKCACGFDSKLAARSAAWHRAHRINHLEVFPRSDDETRKNLDILVAIHEQRETAAAS